MNKKDEMNPNKIDIGIQSNDTKPEIDTDNKPDKDTGVGEDLRPDIEKRGIDNDDVK